MDRLLSMRVFERVVAEGGFAAAARALDLSPPVVTRLVADLEEHLGARLLQRTTRRLALTDAGHAYLGRVRAILQDIDEADAAAGEHTRGLSGVLRLHAPPVLATYVLAPLLAAFRERYPLIRLDVEVESTAAPPIEDFDITLLATDEHFDAGIVARKLIESEVMLVAAPAYLARRGVPATPQDLARHDCLRVRLPLVRTRTWVLWPAHDPDQTETVTVEPVLQVNHTDTVLRAALDGAGICAMTVDVGGAYLTRGELVRVLAPWILGRLSLYAAMPSRKFVPQRTRVFMDFLTEHVRALRAQALAACSGRVA
ncbi:LysR family transcriptional regulator [Aquabacterium sp. A08]|uniref:LysR family transcriptional regulator n=1 Tax=Aquabacterium sp. A08 TaxID=2718532 RepID=UPI00141E887F|nr:LysR family transcriptional regulator [Aquabacterium sp. A08]NIC42848.1 LysR family transcriptional regulator [Aquabacterium sp. A08]